MNQNLLEERKKMSSKRNLMIFLLIISFMATSYGATGNIEKITISPSQYNVEYKFKEIQNIPYNEKTMNCKVKSKIFADYLLNNGGHDINLVVIEHVSGEYSHEFVEWNGRYYDPCNSGESYTLTEEEYIKKLRNKGFKGMIIKSPYIGS